VEYKQNRLEDFQVVFVETAPFAFLLSYGLTALASYAINGSAKMDKHNTPYLAAGTLLLAGGAAYLSVSGKPYDPKACKQPICPQNGEDGRFRGSGCACVFEALCGPGASFFPWVRQEDA
jgi:hypothetical protein